MRWALCLLPLIGGCGGDGESTANRATPAANGAVLAPINNLADISAAPDNAAPPPVPASSKPLVSRETSPRPKPPADYRAIGTEPFWAVTLHGATATLERPDKAPIRFAISHRDDGDAIRYRGEGFAMTLTPGPCSDGMSDAIWSDRVAVAFGDGTLKGCGGERDAGD